MTGTRVDDDRPILVQPRLEPPKLRHALPRRDISVGAAKQPERWAPQFPERRERVIATRLERRDRFCDFLFGGAWFPALLPTCEPFVVVDDAVAKHPRAGKSYERDVP